MLHFPAQPVEKKPSWVENSPNWQPWPGWSGDGRFGRQWGANIATVTPEKGEKRRG